MAGMLAIAGAVAWLLVSGWCAAVTRLPSLRGGMADPRHQLYRERPALVSLCVTRCRLTRAAYPATILDLAARGYLSVSQRAPGQLWVTLPASSSDSGLTRSEAMILTGAGALAAGGGAPFEALADSCASDVRGRWDPFEQAARAEARQAGLTRPRLPVTAQILLYTGAAGVLAGPARRGHLPGTGDRPLGGAPRHRK